MRTLVKMSVVAVGAAAMLATSATAASAGGTEEVHHATSHEVQSSVCGNTAQESRIFVLGGIVVGPVNEADGNVICQSGWGNSAHNFAPEIDLGWF
ncbi:hypothetical protein [Streptomyces sp. GC420]|uniref:hypothetical protein n=1 Tax=Streptomyces sp. GC420 TaxID=2697568 RepID=UPI001414EF4C|nr:hypothetical protein [Streptomyces sp. GC420]NBM15162.1 hypothetical protein [Streptomyces sp. GC420]